MKCVCGYIEPEATCEQVEVRFQSGKRKGELKHIQDIWTYPEEKDMFKQIKIEKGFGFETQGEWSYFQSVELYMCPECHTIKADMQ